MRDGARGKTTQRADTRSTLLTSQEHARIPKGASLATEG